MSDEPNVVTVQNPFQQETPPSAPPAAPAGPSTDIPDDSPLRTGVPDTPSYGLSMPAESNPTAYNLDMSKDTARGPILGPDDAMARAQRVDYGLGPISPGQRNLFESFMNGQEANERLAAAGKTMQIAEAKRLGWVTDYAKTLAPGTIGPDESQAVADMLLQPIKGINPETIFESTLAQKMITQTLQLDNNSTYSFAANAGHQQSYVDTLFGIEGTMTKQQIARNILEEVEAENKNAGYLTKGLDVLAGFAALGFRDWMVLGSGTSRRAEIERMYMLGPQEFEKAAREFLATPALASSPALKLEYANQLMGYTASDAFIANADIVTNAMMMGGFGAGKAVIKQAFKTTTLVPGVSNIKSMASNLITTSAQRAINPLAVIDAGEPFLAAQIAALKRLAPQEALRTIGNTTGVGSDIADMLEQTMTLSNPTSVLKGSVVLNSRELADRFVKTVFNPTTNLLREVFINPLTINRFTEEELAANFGLARKQFQTEFPSLNNAVMDVKHIPAENTLAKTDTYAVTLGRTTGEAFDTLNEARRFQLAHGVMGDIIPANGKFQIRIFKTLDETSPAVRNNLGINFDSNNNIQAGMKTWLPFLRTKKDLLVQGISKYTDVVATTQNGINKAAKQLWTAIDALPGTSKVPFEEWGLLTKDSSRKKFSQYLSYQRDFISADNVRGVFDKSVPEFEANWQKIHGVLPTEKEISAYFAYTKLSDLDYVGLNLGIYRDKLRLGTMNYALPFKNNANPNGLFTKSIEGKVLNGLPKNPTQDAGIYVWDKDLNKHRWYSILNVTDKQRLDWEVGGYKVVQVGDAATAKQVLSETPGLNKEQIQTTSSFSQPPVPRWQGAGIGPNFTASVQRTVAKSTPLFEGMKRDIDYIMVKDGYQQSALKFQQLPYRAGGHVQLQNPWMVSQASLASQRLSLGGKEMVFNGDKNLFSARWEQDAKGWARMADEGRLQYKAWKVGAITEDAAKAAVEPLLPQSVHPDVPNSIRHTMPVDWERFKGMFEGDDAFLDPNSPIMHRPLNQSSYEFHNLPAKTGPDGNALYPNLRRNIDGEHSLFGSQVNMRYATERGDFIGAIKDTGSKLNPGYNVVPTGHIDPLVALQQSFDSVARGRVLDDAKFKIAENFVQGFKDVLVGDIRNLRADPFKTLAEGRFQDIQGGNKQLVDTAKAYQKAALEFMNIQTERQTKIEAWKSRVEADLVKHGREGDAETFSRIMPWNSTNDFANFVRGLTFDNAMFLNPAQILMQGLASLHNIAVLGVVPGMRALSGGLLMHMLGRGASEDFVTQMGRKAAAMGYPHFEEAYNALERTNWRIVGRETADLNDYMHTSISGGLVSNLRDFGRSFFKIGESYGRMSSWAGAFHEWRVANPTATLTDRAIADILYRADTLSVNMMSSAAASWQKGLLSIPTQFMAWNMRLAEQMLPGWSNRLTPIEKLRAFATYGAIFGVPVALTGTVGIWPIHTEINNAAKNYYGLKNPLNDNIVGETFNHGIAQTVIHHMTGGDYNLSQKFGTNGISLLHDVVTGDYKNSIFKTLTGPMGQGLSNYWNVIEPFSRYATGVFRNTNDEFPLTQDNFVNLMRQTTGISNGMKAWAMYNTGIYMSNHNVPIEHGMDGWDAAVLGFLGAVPQRVQDGFDTMNDNQELKSLQKYYEPKIIELLRAQWKSIETNSLKDSQDYAKQVKTYLAAGGFTDANAHQLFKKAADGYDGMLDRVNAEFYNLHPDVKNKLIDGKLN